MAGVLAPEAPPAPPAARRMAAIASASVAGAAWCAAAAAWLPVGGVVLPLAILGACLAAGAWRAAARPSPRVLPPGKDVLVLTIVTFVAFFAASLAGWVGADRLVDAARLLPLGILGLSILWPEPNILRYSLLLAGGTLLGAPEPSRPAVVGALVFLAAGLVATNRLVAAAAPRLGGVPPVRGRRLAAEAGAVLAIVGLLAALAASLLPPPPGEGGAPGDGRPRRLPEPAAPAVHFDERLTPGAGRGEPGDEYVLLVQSPRADVWRALTYDHWDGESWSRSPEERTFTDDGVLPGIGDAGDAERDRLFQAMTVLARFADVLVAAPRPTYASIAGDDVLQGADASLYPAAPLRRGERYFVISDQARASAAELRAAWSPRVPPDVADAYLQLPAVAPRVRELAAQIAGGGPTAFDRALAVEDWILDNTSVTDEAAPVPAGADPLETFLFDDRAGPPERAATAMAVMLRAVGVPARMAVGYLPGQRGAPDEPFVVRASDAHAWVEVWFPTVGWQRFDPTGRAPDPRTEDSVWDRLLRFLKKLWPLLVLLLVAGAAWLAWRVARWQRRRAALPWSTRYFARLERAGAARGRPRRPEETPQEYTSGLAAGPLPDPRLAEVGELVTVAAWSRREPPAEERARAEKVLRAAKKAAPVRRLRRPYTSRLRRRRPRPTIAKP
jgi:transglutaminase-like putative cysteine protease